MRGKEAIAWRTKHSPHSLCTAKALSQVAPPQFVAESAHSWQTVKKEQPSHTSGALPGIPLCDNARGMKHREQCVDICSTRRTAAKGEVRTTCSPFFMALEAIHSLPRPESSPVAIVAMIIFWIQLTSASSVPTRPWRTAEIEIRDPSARFLFLRFPSIPSSGR